MDILPAAFYELPGLRLLTALPGNVEIMIVSAIGFQLLYLASHPASKYSSHYRELSSLKQTIWRVRCVSTFFAVSVSVWAAVVAIIVGLRVDPVLGNSREATNLFGYACGYFVWDVLESIVHIREQGFSFVLHGIAALVVYGITFVLLELIIDPICAILLYSVLVLRAEVFQLHSQKHSFLES